MAKADAVIRRVLFLVLSLVPRSLTAQDISGSLEGRVVTLDSAPVAEVQVTIIGPDLQRAREARSDPRGFFLMLDLPAGSFTVRLARIGFRPLVVDNVPIRIGSTTDLGVLTFEPQAVELGDLTVRAPPLSIDPASTTVGANVDAATYDALPVGRNYRSVVDMLPLANTSYYPADPVNVGGATGLENAYFIDGFNVTDPQLGNPGSVSPSSFVLPYNFVRNVEVTEAGYGARYGRAIGGMLNAVTYSGGNTLDGNVFAFFTNDALTGQPRVGLNDVERNRFTNYDVGARVGGPILHDRLWFSAAYNPQVETANIGVPGFGDFVDRSQRHVFAGKLTWQPAASMSVELLVFGDRSTHHEVSTAAFSGSGLTAAGNPDPYLLFIRAGHTSTSVRLTRQLGVRGVLEASFARVTSFVRQGGETGLGVREPLYEDLVTGTVSGGVGGEQLPSDARTSAALGGTLELGSHALGIGVEYEDNRYGDLLLSNVVERFKTAMWSQDSSFAQAVVHNRVPTLYAEDSWRLAPRLTVVAGLRWSAEYLVGSVGVAQSFPGEWQPRLGAALQLGRLGSQRVFGSWGIVYQQQPLDLAFDFYVPFAEVLSYFSSDPRLASMRPDSTVPLTTVPSQFRNIPGIQVEHDREVTLGYERLIGTSLKVTARGVQRDLLSAFGAGVIPTGRSGPTYYLLGVPGLGALSFLPHPKRAYTALELSAEWAGPRRLQTRFSYVLSRTYGNYTGFYCSDYGSACPGFLGGLEIGEQVKNSSGLLPNDRTHVLKLSGAYPLGFGLTTGVFFTWQSGTPRNEFGLTESVWRTFLLPRGSDGRTPSIWDLSIRFGYPFRVARGIDARTTLDWLHIGSPRRPVWFEQLHYTAEDANRNPISPNPTYGQVLSYQPPTQARLGVEFSF